SIDIRDLAHGERTRAHDAAATRDQRDGYGDDDVEDAAAEHRDHGERQDDQGKRDQDIEHALEEEVEPAAEIGAGHTQDQAHDARAEAHDQGGARAEYQSREDVAPHLVGAQEVDPARRLHHGAEVVLLRIERRNPVGEAAGEEHDQDDREADGPERLATAEL